MDAPIKNLEPGKKLSQVYVAAKEAVEDKFRNQFPQIIGHGIGASDKEY
jgi:hypothetical protein